MTASVLDDFEAEQRDLEALLRDLADADWARPTPAAGWDVRDQVSHLADTEELAHDTATGGPRQINVEIEHHVSGDAFTLAGCVRGRAMSPRRGARVVDRRGALATAPPSGRSIRPPGCRGAWAWACGPSAPPG